MDSELTSGDPTRTPGLFHTVHHPNPPAIHISSANILTHNDQTPTDRDFSTIAHRAIAATRALSFAIQHTCSIPHHAPSTADGNLALAHKRDPLSTSPHPDSHPTDIDFIANRNNHTDRYDRGPYAHHIGRHKQQHIFVLSRRLYPQLLKEMHTCSHKSK
jgi:hypothetical protein